MLMTWAYSIISVFIVSIVSLVGVMTISLKEEKLRKILLFLVSFSAGALLGGAFMHLLPEAVEEYGFGLNISTYLLLGIITFFAMEKFIHWRHCHIPTSKSHPHPYVFMNLIGDGFHNFIDGMVIGGSYLVSIPLGLATTMAVIFHEIPQEIGDFGVLLHGGFSKFKALFFNFLTALTAVIGVIVSLLIGGRVENFTMFLIPFTAGGFIYIAGSDLIPELHKENVPSKSIMQLVSLLLGILVMFFLTFFG
jgi:zinc and cadmium transporter